MSAKTKTYWRLSVQRPRGAVEYIDLRSRSKIKAGDEASNDICLTSTAIPFEFLLVRANRKGPIFSLTQEVRDTLRGDALLKKEWKNRLYQGADFQLATGIAEWDIGDVHFKLENVPQLDVEPLAKTIDKDESKRWLQSFGYTAAAYLFIILFVSLSLYIQNTFFKNTEELVQVQKITVADAQKILKKPELPVEQVEQVPQTEATPQVEQPKAETPELKQSVKPPRKIKPAMSPKVANGKTGGQKPRSVTSMGLFAVQTSPGASRVAMNVAAPNVINKKSKATSDPQLGLGKATAGLGFGENGEGVQVASLGKLSGESYQGGLGEKLTKARVPSIQLARKEVEVRGALDPAIIRQIIEERLSEIRYCYENALLKHTGLAGKVSAAWTIQSDGTVQNINSASEEIQQPVLHPCIRAQIKNWKFPKPKGGGVVHVRYPFVFNPVGGMN